MLPDRDPWFCSGRIPLSMGQRREVCFFSRRPRSWAQTFPIIQNDSTNNKKHLWTHNGGGEHHRVGCPRRYGSQPSRVRPHLGGLRTNLRPRAHAHWGWCQTFHNGGNWKWKRVDSNRVEGEESRKDCCGPPWVQPEKDQGHLDPGKNKFSCQPWGNGERWSE